MTGMRMNSMTWLRSSQPGRLSTELKAIKVMKAIKASLAAAAFLVLAGCSGMRVVDSDVTSFAQWTGPAPEAASNTRFRFERLPSQAAGTVAGTNLSQDELETMARLALTRSGLLNEPAAAALNVQVIASVRAVRRYNNGFGPGLGGGVSLGTGTAGSFIGLSFPLGGMGGMGGFQDAPLFLYEVSLVMRDARSNAVVYETRAAHSGIWGDVRAIYPAMLDAALQGFPRPPAGTRRVNVEIPR